MPRMRFRAITTDVNGLHPGHAKKVDRVLLKTVKQARREMEKVTNRFTHPNSPRFQTTLGVGDTPDSGGGAVGRTIAPPRLRARWAASYTSNDPIYFYLDSGARRFRRMSADWQSMTRPGAGNVTFPRAGRALAIMPHQVGYIEPRNFAIHAIMLRRRVFERDMRRIFGRDATYRFFGRVRHG